MLVSVWGDFLCVIISDYQRKRRSFLAVSLRYHTEYSITPLPVNYLIQESKNLARREMTITSQNYGSELDKFIEPSNEISPQIYLLDN